MKRTTIAMIVIAIAVIPVMMAIIFSNITRRSEMQSNQITGNGPYVTSKLPSFRRLTFEEGNTYFVENFPGFKITVSPKATSPEISAPEEIMPYLKWEATDNLLTLSTYNSDSLNDVTLKCDRQVILTLPTSPEMVTNNRRTFLTFDSVSCNFITLQTRGKVTLKDSYFDSIHLNGNDERYYRNLLILLEGKSAIGMLTVFDMNRDITLHTDSASVVKRLTWLGSENSEHTLRLDSATVERFTFVRDGDNSSIKIVTSDNLISALSSR